IVGDGEAELAFDLDEPARPIDRLPKPDEMAGDAPFHVDRHSERVMTQGFRLLRGLRDFHRQARLTVRERLSGPNEVLFEAAKVLFLEAVRLRDGACTLFPADGRMQRLDEVFSAAQVHEHGEATIALLRTAFDHFKAQADYAALDD